MRHEPNITPMLSGADGPAGLELNFDEVLALMRLHWRIIAASVITCLALAAVYLIVTPAQYTATSLLLIDARSNVVPTQQIRATDANAESAHVETQVEVLRSERIARAVIVAENLAKLQEFAGSRSFLSQISPFGTRTTAKPAEPSTDRETLESEVPALAVKQFNARLNVKRNSSTHIIEISFRHSDPKLAARIANAVASAYLAEQLRQRDEIIRSTSQWLRQRAVELLGEAHQAETALLKFRSTTASSDSASRIVLRDLETTAQTYRWFSENFQKRFLETSQSSTFNVADARVVSEAYPPLDKSHPKGSIVLALALAAGLSIGFLIALARGKTVASAA
ncbi:MAG: Wzz/FepE/Etk N-terminal domain-containing protein [Hyphomicrobiaceae bacterium]